MRALIAVTLLVVGVGLGFTAGLRSESPEPASPDPEPRGAPATGAADRPAEGRDAQEEGVMATVDALFAAMAAKDTAALAAVFHPEARLNSASVRDGEPVLGGASVADFVRSVGGAQVTLDERLGPAEVLVDGPLATAWTPYAFFADGEFSHCGVNAFHLVRTAEGWKVLQITDTRRRDGCPSGAPR